MPSIRELQDYIMPIHPAGRHPEAAAAPPGAIRYIGLNGIQLLSPQPVHTYHLKQIVAEPPSIASMPQLANDPRTVDKLVDGTNSSYDDRHMFLAPFTGPRQRRADRPRARRRAHRRGKNLELRQDIDARRALV